MWNDKFPWNDTFRLSEAAKIIGVEFRFLRGWHERGLVVTVGRDTSRQGHPHLITFTEMVRLAVAVEVQRLSTVGLDAMWNPRAFLAPFRYIPDHEIQQIPKGTTGGTRPIGWRDDEEYLECKDDEASDRPEDLVIVISNRQKPPTSAGQEFGQMQLKFFRKSVGVFLVMDTAWMLVNVSNVIRRLLAAREDYAQRRGGER